ncbi:hypothetical protein B0H14DRAFT_2610380 [Mycena olivaceomarginata]|nr:hypothetical protein B0H14DRAFT_2610380 [Mycena olivaceomarginata]
MQAGNGTGPAVNGQSPSLHSHQINLNTKLAGKRGKIHQSSTIHSLGCPFRAFGSGPLSENDLSTGATAGINMLIVAAVPVEVQPHATISEHDGVDAYDLNKVVNYPN